MNDKAKFDELRSRFPKRVNPYEGSVIIHSRSVGDHEREYFFSTDHCQRVSKTGEDKYPQNQGWVPTTFRLPMSVVPREELPSGRITNLEELLLIFYPGEKHVPNPDPAFEPAPENRFRRYPR